MKRKYLFIVPLVAGSVALADSNEMPVTTAIAGESSSPQVEQAAVPLKPSASVEERAAKLGFAKHLPKNIEIYDGIFNGAKAFEKLLATPLGKFVEERLDDEGVSFDDLKDNPQVASQLAQYSEEYFTAYGAGTDESFVLGKRFFERLAYYGARFGVFMADGLIREGEGFEPESPQVVMDGPLKGAPKELVKMFAEFDVPAFYQGAKVSDEDSREELAAQMEQGVSMLGFFQEASEPITVKRGDTEFSGYKLSGAKFVGMIDDEDEEKMKQVFDVEDIEAFKKALSTKNLVVVSGVVDEYVILFVGKSEDDLVIVSDVNESMCASNEIVFVDSYLDKELLFVSFRSAATVKSMGGVDGFLYSVVSAFAEGLSSGLSEATSLGDTQDLEAILDSFCEQGRKLAAMFTGTESGYVGFIQDGFKVESYGGSDQPSLDLVSTHTLAPMAGGDGTLLFANWTNNEAYNAKVMEYVDTLGETSYLVAKRIAALDIEGEGLEGFKQGLGLFDAKFRDDVLEVWQALRGDMADGLGAETALVVDVNGVLPKIPNVPGVVLEEGRIPRMAYVSTVDDRSKLQDSWKRLNTSAERILKTISEMSGDEIPMQVPMSSEKDDLKTWFIPIPFQNDDFVPSVSVSDELFFASSSKTFSEGLAARVKAGGGEPRKGAWLHVNFKVLNQYAGQWLALVDKHADEIIPAESAREDFKANKAMIEGALKAFGSLDELTLHTRREDGRTRTSMHLKTK